MDELDSHQQIKKTVTVKKDGNYGRKKWEVQKEIINKKVEEQIIQTRFLEQRQHKINKDMQIGKNRMVSKDSEAKEKGFYCEVCDCAMNDSITYLDHLNGKQHNRNLGMNMKVAKVGLEQVIRKFESLKAKDKMGVKDYEEFEQQFEQQQQSQLKKGKRKTIEQENEDIENRLDELEQMGLPIGFGKKKQK